MAGNAADLPRAIGLPPGLHPRLASDAYHRRELGVVSKSALDLVQRSPAHYKAWIDGVSEDQETPALAFGRAFHCALLEPAVFEQTYATEPEFGDCRFKVNREKRDDWRAANAERVPLSADDYATIVGMVRSVRKHPLAGKMIRDGEPELTVTWNDEETGLPCKCRADYYVRRLRMVADAKSTEDASPEAFRRDIGKYRYHVQDALYRAGFAAANEAVEHFVFIAVEKKPPFAVGIYSLDADAIGRGYGAARRNIDTLAECVSKRRWPGYDTSIQELSLPPWI